MNAQEDGKIKDVLVSNTDVDDLTERESLLKEKRGQKKKKKKKKKIIVNIKNGSISKGWAIKH